MVGDEQMLREHMEHLLQVFRSFKPPFRRDRLTQLYIYDIIHSYSFPLENTRMERLGRFRVIG